MSDPEPLRAIDIEAEVFHLLTLVQRGIIHPMDALGRLADLYDINELERLWELPDNVETHNGRELDG